MIYQIFTVYRIPLLFLIISFIFLLNMNQSSANCCNHPLHLSTIPLCFIGPIALKKEVLINISPCITIIPSSIGQRRQYSLEPLLIFEECSSPHKQQAIILNHHKNILLCRFWILLYYFSGGVIHSVNSVILQRQMTFYNPLRNCILQILYSIGKHKGGNFLFQMDQHGT